MKFRIAAAITGFAMISVPANAVTVDIVNQSTADFTTSTLPLTSVSPFTSQTTGTVYFGVTGSSPDIYRSPFENVSVGVSNPDGNGGYVLPGYDNLPYTSVQANSTATYTFAGEASSLSLLWGSPDSYNYIEFFSGPNGTLNGPGLEGIISGSALPFQTYGHDQLTLALDGGLHFESVLLYSSGSNAFEFANLLARVNLDQVVPLQPTPLPGALALFAGGLGMIGLVAGRKKRRTAGIATGNAAA